MSVSTMTPLERELHGYIVNEIVVSDHAPQPVTVDEDLIKRGIVDSLGVQQLMEFCESRYGIRVADTDLVPDNFRTVRRVADYVERKQSEDSSPGRPRRPFRG